MILKFFLIVSFLFITCLNYAQQPGPSVSIHSVLSSGEWHKLSIGSSPNATGSGMYKIDYGLLKSMLGANIESIDPRKIRLFGNGGRMLPEANADFKYNDLKENAILVIGEDDGKFNENDYILFYGQGPDAWVYNTAASKYNHVKNIYSDYSYYFLTVTDSMGKRTMDAKNLKMTVPFLKKLLNLMSICFMKKKHTTSLSPAGHGLGKPLTHF